MEYRCRKVVPCTRLFDSLHDLGCHALFVMHSSSYTLCAQVNDVGFRVQNRSGCLLVARIYCLSLESGCKVEVDRLWTKLNYQNVSLESEELENIL